MASNLTGGCRSARHREMKFNEHETSFWNPGLEQVVESELVDVGMRWQVTAAGHSFPICSISPGNDLHC